LKERYAGHALGATGVRSADVIRNDISKGNKYTWTDDAGIACTFRE
jgi:hypothetical protein